VVIFAELGLKGMGCEAIVGRWRDDVDVVYWLVCGFIIPRALKITREPWVGLW